MEVKTDKINGCCLVVRGQTIGTGGSESHSGSARPVSFEVIHWTGFKWFSKLFLTLPGKNVDIEEQTLIVCLFVVVAELVQDLP